jgi:ABC-2 type transport system ATP-binding protein
MEVIKVENVSKKYKDNIVLDNVSFKVEEGQIFGIVGKNGKGKSTLLKIISGIIINYDGNVLINCKNIKNEIDKKTLGVFPDVTNFYNELSAIDNVKYLSNIQGINVKEEKIMDMFKSVDLIKYENKKVNAFSTGMKKKLGIVQALINDPKIIILDEPTSGVDIISTKQINEKILDLKKENKTILITSHNIEQIIDICDVIGVLDFGKLTIIEKSNLTKLINRCFLRLEEALNEDAHNLLINRYSVDIESNCLTLKDVGQKEMLILELLNLKCNIIELKDEIKLL